MTSGKYVRTWLYNFMYADLNQQSGYGYYNETSTNGLLT